MSKRYYWPRMTDDIRDFIRHCERCQRVNQQAKRIAPELHPIPIKTPTAWRKVNLNSVHINIKFNIFCCKVATKSILIKFIL